MKRRLVSSIALLLCLICLLFLLSGCKKSSSGGSDSSDAVKQAIAAKINAFKTSVEAYDVDGMLAFLDEDNFEGLSIVEGSNSPQEKDYATLKKELEEDEKKQLYWRKAAPEGKGYVLTMELEPFVYSNLSQTGAVVSVGFTIKEKADKISERVTDTGTMVCEMVKTQGEWLCRRMTINFATMDQGNILMMSLATDSEPTAGFGFGSLLLGD